MIEQWKDIPGYEGLYQVSNMGQVKSLNYNHTGKERILKTRLNKDGYVRLNLSNIKRKTENVHQLVAKAFLGWDKNEYPLIRHLNHNKTDNRLENLSVGTVYENNTDYRIEPGINWRGGRYNKWVAQIGINGKRLHLGHFTNKEDALDMYQKALANTHLYNGDTKTFRKLIDQLHV
jgi:hypothetical protein